MTEALAVFGLVFGIYAGFSAASRLKERETALLLARQFLFALKLSLEYGGKPLGELFLDLSKQERFASFSFLYSLMRQVNQGVALPDAWKTAAAGEEKRLGSEGFALLLRLGAVLGTTDKPGQTELLSRELLVMDGLCKAAKERRERCAAVYRACGAFAGFAVFILVF